MPTKFDQYHKIVARAARRADTDPTEAQLEAGNARVGRLHLHGFAISITHPKGGIRKGRSADGKAWSRVMQHSYGYIRKTEAEDGDFVDVFLAEHPQSQLVFTFDFLTPDHEHDETKVIMGARNVNEAKAVIKKNYPDGWLDDRIGEIRGMTTQQFRAWLKKQNMLKKSAGAYSKEKTERLKKWIKDQFEDKDLSGIYVMVNPDRRHVIVDCMDWGEPGVSKQIVAKMRKEYGENSVIVQNEGGLPKDGVDGWVKLAEASCYTVASRLLKLAT